MCAQMYIEATPDFFRYEWSIERTSPLPLYVFIIETDFSNLQVRLIRPVRDKG